MEHRPVSRHPVWVTARVSSASSMLTGLKQAIAAVLLGASWQRCQVRFLRNVLALALALHE